MRKFVVKVNDEKYLSAIFKRTTCESADLEDAIKVDSLEDAYYLIRLAKSRNPENYRFTVFGVDTTLTEFCEEGEI